MKLRALPRWFKRRIGYARLLCLALLIGFAALRVADPAPVEEIRVRTFDAFQRIDPRKKTTILREDTASKSQNTPFHGWSVRGAVKGTVIGSEMYPAVL